MVEILREQVRTRITQKIGDSLWWDVVEVIVGETPKVTTDR